MGHKGTFGTVLVIGGSCLVPSEAPSRAVRMFGGAALAALAALRSGCGLARLMTPAPLLDAALSVAPVCTGVPMPVDTAGEIIPHLAAQALDHQLAQCHAVVIGPALGGGLAVEQLVLRALGQDRVPVVADADALNALARTTDFARDLRAALVLTPHPGEFERLAGPLGITHDATHEQQRPLAAQSLAQRLGATVVLKGARTVVSDTHDHWTLDRPNPALATGGSGDILAGIIAGLIAQTHASNPRPSLYDLARAGAWAHAEAARRWTETSHAGSGMLASDLLDLLPQSIEPMRR